MRQRLLGGSPRWHEFYALATRGSDPHASWGEPVSLRHSACNVLALRG
jgi:hypothetical protein